MERIENVKGKIEAMEIPMTAKFTECEPYLEMDREDAKLLKEVGDVRTMTQKGKIYSPDGETVIETDLTFIRTRNARGGIDVTCIVPALGLEPAGG